jgi:hypothetical protein
MNMSAQFFKSLSTHRRKALRLLSIFAMSLAVTNSYAMQWCGSLPRDSAAYFACESLNQQERFQNEQRREYQEQKARQEQADLNRRVEEFLREAEMRRERERHACAEQHQCYYYVVNSSLGSPAVGPFSTSTECRGALEKAKARLSSDERVSDCVLR